MEIAILDFVNWYERNPIRKTFEWKTDVVEYDSGINQRNKVWDAPRRHWFINWNVMRDEYQLKVIEVLNRAKGRYDTVFLRDRWDYTATSTFAGDGTTKTFQLYKTYYPGTEQWSEDKKSIKSGTTAVTLDGVPQPSGWSVNCSTGILTFDAAPGNGIAIVATFEFYFKAIFTEDSFNQVKAYPDIWEFAIIELVEAKGE